MTTSTRLSASGKYSFCHQATPIGTQLTSSGHLARLGGRSWTGRDSHVTAIYNLSVPNGLAQEGLSGAQLRLKIAVWRRARAAMIAEFNNSEDTESRSDPLPKHAQLPISAEEPPHPRKLPRRVRRALKFTARMLSYANTILGSLAKLAGQFERFKEIKETVERLSDNMADEYPEAE